MYSLKIYYEKKNPLDMVSQIILKLYRVIKFMTDVEMIYIYMIWTMIYSRISFFNLMTDNEIIS